MGLSVHETWWMAETGIICISNFPSMDIKPGSMGRSVPGIRAAIVDDRGNELPPLSMGELVLKIGWPGLMIGLWKDQKRYAQYFQGGWFHTGDMAFQDEEGYFFHQGRSDNLLKIDGERLIGPYEIERILYMHPSIREAAVISKKEAPGSGISHIKAFISLRPPLKPSNRLKQNIRAYIRGNLSEDVVIREIEFMETLPKTKDGKIDRRILRAQDLGIRPIG